MKILGSFIKRDGNVAGNLMIDSAKKCQATGLDMKLFCEGIQRICDDDEDNVSCCQIISYHLLLFDYLLINFSGHHIF